VFDGLCGSQSLCILSADSNEIYQYHLIHGFYFGSHRAATTNLSVNINPLPPVGSFLTHS
jgi:hypothetical protein